MGSLGRIHPDTFANLELISRYTLGGANPIHFLMPQKRTLWINQPFLFVNTTLEKKNTTGFKLDNTIQGFVIWRKLSFFFSRGCIICLSIRYTSCLSQTSSQVFQMKRFEKVKTFTFFISTVLDLRFLVCVQCCA